MAPNMKKNVPDKVKQRFSKVHIFRETTFFIFSLSIIFIFIITCAKSNLPLNNYLKSEDSLHSSFSASRALVSRSNKELFLCQNLIRNPKPCLYGSKSNGCRGENRGDVMFSQNYQDYYLYTRHFRYFRRPGVYFDIATNHPISNSNTFFLDRCLNWSGVCVEANDQYFEPIFRERTCSLVPTCISRSDGNIVEFNPSGAFGGIIGDSYKYLRSAKMRQRPSRRLRCTTVKDLCSRFGIQNIDYLSLDVEGHEFNVLKGVDWENTRISVITIEINSAFKNISAYLQRKGYKRHKVTLNGHELSKYSNFLATDAIFVHKNVKFGSNTN